MNVTLLRPLARIPNRATDGSAGYDIVAPEDRMITQEYMAIPLGFALAIPIGLFGLIFARSSLAMQGVSILMSTPIDSDYRGEVHVLAKHAGGGFQLHAGTRFAQIVFLPHYAIDMTLVDKLPPTKRGLGGFGSTGTA